MTMQSRQGRWPMSISTVERTFLLILTRTNILTMRRSRTKCFHSSAFHRSQAQCILQHCGHVQLRSEPALRWHWWLPPPQWGLPTVHRPFNLTEKCLKLILRHWPTLLVSLMRDIKQCSVSCISLDGQLFLQWNWGGLNSANWLGGWVVIRLFSTMWFLINYNMCIVEIWLAAAVQHEADGLWFVIDFPSVRSDIKSHFNV